MSINSINYTAPLAPLAPEVNTSSLFRNRKEELIKKVKSFESRLGIKNHSQLKFEDFGSTSSAQISIKSEVVISPQGRSEIKASLNGPATLILPSWFLLKDDDVPQHLRLTNIEDLNDENFLNETTKWINEKMDALGLPKTDRPIYINDLKSLILLLRARNFEEVKDFILAHETAHVSHEDNIKLLTTKIFFHKCTNIYLQGMIHMGIVTLFAIPLIGWKPVAEVLSKLGLILLVSKLSYDQFKLIPMEIQEEKQADMDAKNLLQTGLHGISYFENQSLLNLLIRKKIFQDFSEAKECGIALTPNLKIIYPKTFNELTKWVKNLLVLALIDQNGNDRMDRHHPSMTERIAYLKQV
jgi:hypothetical protein